MSERIWWRDEVGHLDWCYPHHTATIESFERAAHWQRVHVLADAELAAVKAKAWNEGYSAGLDHMVPWLGGDEPEPENPYEKGSDDG